jgi:glycosyltransferase involved in cell wall biosynthesis
VKVVVLTTSYPRSPDDVAGAFVRDAVERLREAGVEVDVVSPASFRHYGLAYGHGIVENLRRRPWKALLLPLFLASYSRAARRAARNADLVHAHWLPSAIPASRTGKPLVLQLWGTDVELAKRWAWGARRLVRRAGVVVCPSEELAAAAGALGAREVRVVPSGVAIPDVVGEPDEPPHVLFVGRLSEEKGILDFLAATEGLHRVVVGDGPLRDRVPEARGFVPPSELGAYYERAAVVVCPSHREGYGVVAREAMAHGRPVVATYVGGLAEAVEDGITGLVVPPRDTQALRAAIERLLADADLRKRLGAAARDVATVAFSWEKSTAATLYAYRSATGAMPADTSG